MNIDSKILNYNRLADSHFKHLLLTRFNLNYGETDYICDEAWHRHRFQLFTAHTLPSVLHQKTDNFEWIIFFNADVKELYQAEINHISEHSDRIRFLFIKPGDDYVSILRRHIQINYSHSVMITSRLDNDDVIASDYLENIQSVFYNKAGDNSFSDFFLINAPSGYQAELIFPYRVSRIKNYRFSSFLTLVSEKRNSGKVHTIYDFNHDEWKGKSDTVELDKKPMWVQLIHEKNLENHIKTLRLLPVISDQRFRKLNIRKRSDNILYRLILFPVQVLISFRNRMKGTPNNVD